MTSKEALTELFNEANRLSFEEPKYTTHDLWKMCKQIQKDLEVLENVKNKTHLNYKQRKQIAKEFNYWCAENNADALDSANLVTWLLCIKLKEWLENE